MGPRRAGPAQAPVQVQGGWAMTPKQHTHIIRTAETEIAGKESYIESFPECHQREIYEDDCARLRRLLEWLDGAIEHGEGPALPATLPKLRELLYERERRNDI